jgi:aquaporin Z
MIGMTRANAVNAFGNLRFHWPEYLMEAGELGLYMFSTCAIATLLQHPASPVRHVIANSFFRRAVMGLGMGATVVAIVTSPWGKQSGAHFNPGVTLTFYRLGKMDFSDAVFYVATQLIGGINGVVIATYLLLGAPGDPAVRYAVTIPGRYGNAAAFVAEMTISFIL